MDIGNKIRELRTRKGLTLEELASRSELTKGFLSQLERDLTSPSIDSLSDILEALGTNLAEFFQEDKNDQFIFHADDFFVDEREDCTVNWIVPNTQKNQMEPILLELNSAMSSKAASCWSATARSIPCAAERPSTSTDAASICSKTCARPLRACCGSRPLPCSDFYRYKERILEPCLNRKN